MGKQGYDEGRVHVGTRGYVYYLQNEAGEREPLAVTVVKMAVSPRDGQMYAWCDDSSGNTRVCLVDEIVTNDGEAH